MQILHYAKEYFRVTLYAATLGNGHMKSVALIIGLAACTAFTGCQTAKRKSTNEVKVVVQPAGAKVTTSLGESCTAPCSFTVKRRKEFTITASKRGFRSQTVKVGRKLNKRAAAGSTAVAVVAPGGSVLGAIDLASGALWDHDPNPVRITLKRGRAGS
ncbi:MAG: translation initiation factor 2 [Pseudomonadota bacterium]